jgi:hypothetical protein
MPDANALDPNAPMSAPVAQWLALQRAKNTAEGIGDDNLLNRVFSRGDPYYAPPPAPAAARPIWSPDNPVGTSVLHDTYAGPASLSFSPLVTRPYADVPITAAKAAEIETGARDYSLNLFGNLALAEVPDIGRLPGEPVALPSKRVRAPGADRPPEPGTRAAARNPRSASLDGHLPFPDAEDPAAQEGPTVPAAALPAQAPEPAPSAEPPATPTPAAAGPVSHSLDGHVPFPDAAPTPPPGAPEPVPAPPAAPTGPAPTAVAPRPTPAAIPELPALPPGHLFDPVLGAQAIQGADITDPAVYEAHLQARAKLLDEGVATLNRPAGKTGTMAGLPELRGMDPAQAIEIARTEPHLIQRPDGSYVGAPANIKSPADIQAMRVSVDAAVARGASGSDWYNRVLKFIDEISGRDPVRGRQLAEEYAVFSAQSDPNTNLGFAQQATNARMRGTPAVKVRTGQQAGRFNDARAAQEDFLKRVQTEALAGRSLEDLYHQFPNMAEGKKTGIFRQHMDQSALPGTTGTNDIWHARVFGYVDPKTGKPWDKAIGEAQHKFLDYETMLAIDRANKANLGGRSNWTAAEIQAAPWVWSKGESLINRFKLSPEEGFRRANETYPDFADRYTADMPREQRPYGASGVGYGSMTPEEWTSAAPRTNPANQLDPQLTHLGFNTRASIPGYGAWQPSPRLPVENNPVEVARPMIDLANVNKQRVVHPGTLAALESSTAVSNLTDLQAAAGATYWDKQAGSNVRRGITIDLGRGTTKDEATALDALATKHELQFTNRAEGAGFLNFSDKLKRGPQVQKLLDNGLEAEIKKIVPDATVGRAEHTGPFVDFKNRLAAANAGKGQATRAMDSILKRNRALAPGATENLLNDPNEAAKAQANLLRLQQSGQLGQRPDYERYLRLLSEGRLRNALDWARANNYRGLPAAAAGVGLGAGIVGEDGSTRPGA